MEIRKATSDDMPGITALLKVCTDNLILNGIQQWDEIYPNTAVFMRDIRDTALYLAVDVKGEICGCVVLNTFQDKEYQQIQWKFDYSKIAVIHRLMVSPKSESQGIGGALLEFTENLAVSQGIQAIRLDMYEHNQRAISFYLKHGYILRGTVSFRKGFFICAEKDLATSNM